MRKNEVIDKILNLIPRQRIFLLIGSLGAGKTNLVKTLSQNLKIKETLTSPTFILWQKYEFKLKKKKYFLNHLDLYRVKTEDILKLDLRKEIKKRENIFFVEWGEKLKSYLNKRKINYIEVVIKRKGRQREYFIKK